MSFVWDGIIKKQLSAIKMVTVHENYSSAGHGGFFNHVSVTFTDKIYPSGNWKGKITEDAHSTLLLFMVLTFKTVSDHSLISLKV